MSEIGNFFVTIGSKLDSKGFDKARASINKVALAGIAMGGALAVAGYKAAQAAGIQERAELTLAQAMQQAGTYTKEAHEHNIKYAASLQTMTEYGDEAILGVQKMLTNFGVEGEMLDKLTKATLDLAAAKKMDLTAAADLVAKSVGSTTNALTRYGIVVEGDVGSTERLQMAVNNITKIFGGAAKANAETFLGSINQLKNIVGDLWEDVGFKLIPIISEFANKIKTEVVPRAKEWIDESGNIETILKEVVAVVKFMTTTTYAFAKIIGFTIQSVNIAKDTFTAWGNRIQQVKMFLTLNTKAAKLFGQIAVIHSNKAKKGMDKLAESVIDAGKTVDDMNKLELDSFKIKEEGKTEILAEQMEIQNEMADEDLEIDLARAANEAVIEEEMRDRKNKKEKELHDNRVIRARQFATVVTEALGYIKNAEVITWAAVAEAYKKSVIDMIGYIIQRLTADFVAKKAIAIMETAVTWGAAAWQIPAVVAAGTTAMAGLNRLQSFDKGGIVPGMIGQPQLAIVHGGETIIPAHSTTNNMGNIYVTVPPITSRRVADEYGKVIGDAIFRKVKKSRRI